MYTLKYAECFKEDVVIACKWYEKINERIVTNFLNELYESEEIIEKNPKANARVLGSKTRRYHLPTFPYKIFYRINEKEIIVFALIHTARSNKLIKKRIK
jgi:mRNA-degrading endonuclease RelE of RelBE toxin-antitoxin system